MRRAGRVVKGGAKGDIGAPVMADQRERSVPEDVHQLGDVGRHRGLRCLLTVWMVRGGRRLAIATQIRADDGEGARQERCDSMPRRVCPRMPVQQDDRRPGTAMPDP